MVDVEKRALCTLKKDIPLFRNRLIDNDIGICYI
jgi:hypothetical protein